MYANDGGITVTTEPTDEHDGLTHLVDAEDATETACGLERTIWTSATQTAMFATCEACAPIEGD